MPPIRKIPPMTTLQPNQAVYDAVAALLRFAIAENMDLATGMQINLPDIRVGDARLGDFTLVLRKTPEPALKPIKARIEP